MQPGALHLNGLWSRLMDRTGGGWFLITRYTETGNTTNCLRGADQNIKVFPLVLGSTHMVLC